MFPIIFGEGTDWALPSFAFMSMLAFLGGVLAFRNLGEKEGLDRTKLVDMAIILGLAGWVGARLAHVLFDGMFMDYVHLCTDPDALGKMIEVKGGSIPCTSDTQCLAAQNGGQDIGALCNAESGQCVPEQDCFRALNFFAGGYTFYGGFILASLTLIFLARRWQWNIKQLLDIGAASVALAQGIGRLGCFLSGCCFGGVCQLPWAVRFPQGSDAFSLHWKTHSGDVRAHFDETGIWESLPVHPTQLYEAFSLLAIFAFLVWYVRPRRRFHGQITAVLLILYGTVRFVTEFWRADQRGGALFFSTSQWIALPLIIMGVVLLWRGLKRAPDEDFRKDASPQQMTEPPEQEA